MPRSRAARRVQSPLKEIGPGLRVVEIQALGGAAAQRENAGWLPIQPIAPQSLVVDRKAGVPFDAWHHAWGRVKRGVKSGRPDVIVRPVAPSQTKHDLGRSDRKYEAACHQGELGRPANDGARYRFGHLELPLTVLTHRT